MANNKPKLRCSCCRYGSDNQSEFLMLSANESMSLLCLVCSKNQNLISFDTYHHNIANAIQKRMEMEKATNGKVLKMSEATKLHTKKDPLIFPKDIHHFLSGRIIGQEDAKRKISVAVSNHLQRIKYPKKNIKKSNVLLMGPTGTGKTEIFRALSEYLSIPMVSTSATNLTAAGYVGQDVQQILAQLVTQSPSSDPYAAQKGIIFIDEIDKLASSQGDSDSVVNTTRVQQELLRIIEGDIVEVNLNGSKTNPELVDIDTKDILFICAGSFVGLEEQISHVEKEMGFHNQNHESSNHKTLKDVTADDLRKYGLIPELIGRLPVITCTEKLTLEDLEHILVEPDYSITREYINLMSTYNMYLEFDKTFIKSIAKEAYDKGTGARGLKSVIEKYLNDLMFDVSEYQNKIVRVYSKDGKRVLEVKENDYNLSLFENS